VLPEFVPLPTRLASSPLYREPFDDVPKLSLTSRYSPQLLSPAASAAVELEQADVLVTSKRSTTYYNSLKSSHAREVDIMDAAGLEGLQSLSECDGDSVTEDSNSVLSSSSYEHLDARCVDTVHLNPLMGTIQEAQLSQRYRAMLRH